MSGKASYQPSYVVGVDVGGTFTETITGLHRNPIFASGTFRLRRASTVTVLNQ